MSALLWCCYTCSMAPATTTNIFYSKGVLCIKYAVDLSEQFVYIQVTQMLVQSHHSFLRICWTIQLHEKTGVCLYYVDFNIALLISGVAG